MGVADAFARVRGVRAAAADRVRGWSVAARGVRDSMPLVVRSITELARVEAVDRATAIGAQALLALLPMLVVLAAFLPDLSGEVTARFAQLTGLGSSGGGAVAGTLDAVSPPDVDVAQVRAATGAVGVLVVVFSASSFARSLQRFYAALWEVARIGGVVGRRRCLSWLVGWLVTMQVVSAVTSWVEGLGPPLLEPAWIVVRWLLLVLVWWWTAWALLLGRVAAGRLLVPATLCATALVVYAGATGLVMQRYVVASAEQFGSLGVVLAVASWLVGVGFVLVVSTTLGKVVDEDPRVAALRARITVRWTGRSRTAGGGGRRRG